MALPRLLRFQCDLKEGWKLVGKTGSPLDLTSRGKQFLPVIAKFLRARPTVESPIGIVQQAWVFKSTNGDKFGTLLSLQELPAEVVLEGAKHPKLLVPALYVEEPWNDTRRKQETDWLRRYVEGSGSFDKLIETLEQRSWRYDAVFQLLGLEAQTISDQNKSLVLVQFHAIGPSSEKGFAIHPKFPFWDCDDADSSDDILRSCFCLPWVHPKVRLLDETECVPYLVGFEESRQTLKGISDIWRSGSARNVLLAAEPGSGKDVVARLLHFGRGHGAFKSISAGGQSWQSFQIPLLGQGQPAGPPLFKGLIEEAEAGTLFVDEIDKANADVRAALLRVLEADEFYRPGSGTQVKVPPKERPLFVFAGSGKGDKAEAIREEAKKTGEADKIPKSVRDAIELESPPDFWQRIDSHLEMKHPLGNTWGPPDSATLAVLTKYVRFFMRRAKETHPLLGYEDHSPYAADVILRLSAAVIKERINAQWEVAVQTLCETHIRETGPRQKRPSLRDIRSVSKEFVGRMCELAQVQDISPGAVKMKLRTLAKEAYDHATG